MPELPEVETVRLCLVGKVVGQKIQKLWIKKGSRLLRDTSSAAALRKKVEGRTIEALGRRGKYLIFALSSGDFLIVHLGMTGQLYTIDKREKLPPHTHLRFELFDQDLILVDPRTFGRVLFAEAGGLETLPALAGLGPEPLDKSFDLAHVKSMLSDRKACIKALLLGQKLAAGVGNIYADEALHRAGIDPRRPGGSLSDSEMRALIKAVRKVIKESIACKGTTIRDYIWDAARSGDFAPRLRAYGREGKACKRCGKKIRRELAAQRSTYFCPGCQK